MARSTARARLVHRMDDANAMIERLIDALVWVLPGLLLLLLVILVLSYTDRQRRRNGNSDKQA